MTVQRSGGYDRCEFVAEYYDVIPLHAQRADLVFWLQLASKANGPILELGCGTGRVLSELAKAGYSVDGIDSSAAMLAKCRAKVEALAPDVRKRIRVVQADMTKFKLGKMYALVIAPFRAFAHLIDIDDQVACLQSVHACLSQSGRLVLDLFNPDPARMHDARFLSEIVEFQNLLLPDGRKLGRSSRTASFHPAKQYNDTELIYYVENPDGSKERLVHDFPIRLFFRYEIENLLERCHFRVINVFGGYDQSDYADRSAEMVVVAEKRLKTN
jgi:SAM-dependent methyltransferase